MTKITHPYRGIIELPDLRSIDIWRADQVSYERFRGIETEVIDLGMNDLAVFVNLSYKKGLKSNYEVEQVTVHDLLSRSITDNVLEQGLVAIFEAKVESEFEDKEYRFGVKRLYKKYSGIPLRVKR